MTDDHVMSSSGWHSFRDFGKFSYYGESFVAAKDADPKVLRVVAICALFSLSAIVAVLGIRGHEKWIALLKTVCTLYVGVALLLGLYGKNWQVGRVKTAHAYISRGHVAAAEISVFIGLNELNITLSADYDPSGNGKNIYFNEEFHWSGRLVGQGQTIGIEDFEASRKKGVPFALLTVIDHLTCDFGDWKWARKNRQGGYYATICLWTAFAVWLLCNVSFCLDILYAAQLMTLCGALTLLSNLLYWLIQPPSHLAIQFEDGSIHLKFGWTFWMVLAAGAEFFLIGVAIWITAVCSPDKTASMFDLEATEEDYYYYDEVDTASLKSPLQSSGLNETQFNFTSVPAGLKPCFADNPVFEIEDIAEDPKQDEPIQSLPDSGINSPTSKGSLSDQGSDSDAKDRYRATDTVEVAIEIDEESKRNGKGTDILNGHTKL